MFSKRCIVCGNYTILEFYDELFMVIDIILIPWLNTMNLKSTIFYFVTRYGLYECCNLIQGVS